MFFLLFSQADSSLMTFEGHPLKGAQQIMGKLMVTTIIFSLALYIAVTLLIFSMQGLVFQTISRRITNAYCHPLFDGGILTATGEYNLNRVVFRHNSGSLRTDESFRRKADPEHHRGTSELEKLPLFDMVNGFSLDYMHLILLGVVKKISTALTTNIKRIFKVKLQNHVIEDISGRLTSLAGWLPVEFKRKTRSLEDLSRWKAYFYTISFTN